uniref:Uncharacterized protein n=1 Tax=Knipowitschia caucasica TaxID=637954 RepID=A0AAV2L5W8_KNICA
MRVGEFSGEICVVSTAVSPAHATILTADGATRDGQGAGPKGATEDVEKHGRRRPGAAGKRTERGVRTDQVGLAPAGTHEPLGKQPRDKGQGRQRTARNRNDE